MNAIRIRTTIASDTLHIPELKEMMGRTVEIIVLEESTPPPAVRGKGDWDAVLAASQRLQEYDYDARADQDARDIRDAEERLK